MTPTTLNNIPGPKSLVPLLTYIQFRRKPIEFLSHAARRYGDVVHFRFGPQSVFLLNHPDLIRDVLVTYDQSFIKGRGLERAKRLLGEGLLTSEGAFHRRQRRLVQPAFHRQRVQAYGSIMTQYANDFQLLWSEGSVLEMDREMMRLTLSVVAKALFDTELSGEAREIGEALTTAIGLWRRMMLPFAEYLEKLPLPSNRKFERARDRLDTLIYRIIEQRRVDGKDHGDLLSMLLSVQDSEGDGGGMTDRQLRDELLTLFLAGHETTANALTWTWYLLSQYPEVEHHFHQELDSVLGDRLPEFGDLTKLVYTEKVLAESMRLYPPAWIIGRRAIKKCDLPSCSIPSGALVLLSQFLMHRDERFFPNPMHFDPERWTGEAKAARPKFSYFPFGGGSRQCIGEAFAWMEGVLLLATIARRWRPRLVPGHPIALQPLVTLRPKYGIRMIVEKRRD